jgi:hypothetical protein
MIQSIVVVHISYAFVGRTRLFFFKFPTENDGSRKKEKMPADDGWSSFIDPRAKKKKKKKMFLKRKK